MESVMLLKGVQIGGYAHMIPEWLLERPREGVNVRFFGMEEEGTPCGVAVLGEEERVLTLQYLYLEENYRGEGRGQRFLNELLLDAYHGQNDTFRVAYVPEEFPQIERLLKAYPFTQEEEPVASFTCTLGQLMENKYIQGAYGSNVRALSECQEEGLRTLSQIMEERGDALVKMPLEKKDYVADCSAVVLEKGSPAGILLVREEGKGEVSIPLLVNYSANVTAPVEMIRFAVQAGSQNYPKETVCRFAVVSESLLQFLEKLGFTFGNKRRLCTLELSYFEPYERNAQSYLDDEYYNL